jgi:hypothetical protein
MIDSVGAIVAVAPFLFSFWSLEFGVLPFLLFYEIARKDPLNTAQSFPIVFSHGCDCDWYHKSQFTMYGAPGIGRVLVG